MPESLVPNIVLESIHGQKDKLVRLIEAVASCLADKVLGTVLV